MDKDELFNCEIKLRNDPQRHKDRVYVGCGAGFGGDRPSAALKLLQRVKELDYLVLECLAERTLADRYKVMMSGGKGFDPRISEWMTLLLPLAVERGVCIITNMGAVDPLGAQKEVLDVACNLGLEITVSVAHEVPLAKSEYPQSSEGSTKLREGKSTYLGAAPIAYCLEKYKPHVVITSRVADAALFLAPMVYELGWNWNDYEQLAQGSLAGHLLECGCQLTGGYFMHPGDTHRDFPFEQLLDLSLPFAEVSFKGEVYVAKADGSGGVLNFSTCAEQLLYEVGDPGRYITPDLAIDLSNVNFRPISNDRVVCIGAKPSSVLFPEKLLQLVPMDCGWKGWGEISYGGPGCVRRAQAAEYLVRSWMEEAVPGVKDHMISYVVGYDSLKTGKIDKDTSSTEEVLDVRLRMDGLFELEEHAIRFTEEFIALYTNGPAGGGGISTEHKKETILQKELVDRENVFWRANMKRTNILDQQNHNDVDETRVQILIMEQDSKSSTPGGNHLYRKVLPPVASAAAPANKRIALYQVAHSRTGDKGNDLNFSLIPHFPTDLERLKKVVTPDWVQNVVSALLDASLFSEHKIQQSEDRLKQVRVEIYEAPGIHSLNVVVQNILDGGVNCSRRIDRHGKTVSDLILSQEVVLPP
ncbi:uncharacterized protein LOC109707748 isoform X1 [Ananas comosus]|uniref:Uncharacterized protein LOC109707748 isoform X1 n=1 Tax=Ananas comosus TaxID=4615 RepID=A0A6P5EUL4_ANACO|nr:uncharacterized protein LOC109707748 isoform X1 [Ananas comosus]